MFKKANNNTLSFILGGVNALLALFGLYLATQNLQQSLMAGVISGLLTYAICYYITKIMIFDRLLKINNELEKISKSKINTRASEKSQEYLIFELERSIQRLIREQSSEIEGLKKMEKFRKDFLGNVAHELRSPIFNVQGYIYTLLEGAMDDPNVNARFLKKAANNIDHLSNLVQDLITVNMIESGELELEMSNFNIKELAREVIELLDLPAKNKGIALQIKCNGENGMYVHADKDRIKQVFINLITNSIKYGKENGHTNVQLTDLNNIITIEISDNGEGISDEHLPRIFERFYRVDKSRTRSQSSTGLGLAIVKHFIEAHKQHILVSSIEKVGSIFSFSLEKGSI